MSKIKAKILVDFSKYTHLLSLEAEQHKSGEEEEEKEELGQHQYQEEGDNSPEKTHAMAIESNEVKRLADMHKFLLNNSLELQHNTENNLKKADVSCQDMKPLKTQDELLKSTASTTALHKPQTSKRGKVSKPKARKSGSSNLWYKGII
jgi:hypothetical protein